MEEKKAVKFLNLLGLLKYTPRSGWQVVQAPFESVASHVFRTALIGLVLAKLAKLNENEELTLLKICLLHDTEECYILDLHKIAKKFLKIKKNLLKKEILNVCPNFLKDDINLVLNDSNKKIKPSKNKKLDKIYMLAMDADKLECILTAKYYYDLGFKTESWIKNNKIITREGKLLLKNIKNLNTLEFLKLKK
jgi:putative hydrolase of HD superfamily